MLTISRYVGAVLLALLIHLYFYQSTMMKELDYKFYDLTQLFLSDFKAENTSYTVIIDIDEKSLQTLGQWPWPRVINAKLIDKINKMNPSALGINILFPEKDRTSPLVMQEFYKRFFNLNIHLDDFPIELQDNDNLLAQSIQRSGATLSTYFHDSPYTDAHCQKLLYKEDLFKTIETDLNTPSLLCNYETLQNKVENFGFINASVDSDGIFRRIPLFVDYKNHIFPSFALATILSFDKYININTKNSSILVDFSTKPKVFSAIDVLNGNILASEIQGKVVILGSSLTGLSPTYMTSTGKKISSSMVHASVIDNILENSFLVENKIYKTVNLLISFFISLLIILLLFKRFYLHVGVLFLFIMIISFSYLFNAYLAGVYISIAYLWVPFLLFFTLILLYHIKFIEQEQQEQEKLLIRQSKLASLGEMISLIAHQWRQPLSSINGSVLNIDMNLRKQNLYSKELDKQLNEIEETTNYLSETIHDFTDFFLVNKKKETFYISEVIKQAQRLLALSNTKEVQIIYTKNRADIEITGYRSELVQSLLILLNNSVYACHENLDHHGQGEIIIDTYLKKELLSISVEDNGKGIDKKTMKKIFNPYFTTKNRQHGTGLGLYILKLIIENSMNGRIFVSNGEKGAIFTIEIPKNIV
jgi:signal transduction histidine kinase